MKKKIQEQGGEEGRGGRRRRRDRTEEKNKKKKSINLGTKLISGTKCPGLRRNLKNGGGKARSNKKV